MESNSVRSVTLTWFEQPEAYASIHKSSPRGGPSQMSDSGLTQRRGSTAREDVDNSTYSNINAAYASTYTAYGRTPAQVGLALCCECEYV
uniref:Uncharacterized protein n=1 Tax=Parascaris equorum TaxID=6256 RepID=A0A914RYA5_PAREQ